MEFWYIQHIPWHKSQDNLAQHRKRFFMFCTLSRLRSGVTRKPFFILRERWRSRWQNPLFNNIGRFIHVSMHAIPFKLIRKGIIFNRFALVKESMTSFCIENLRPNNGRYVVSYILLQIDVYSELDCVTCTVVGSINVYLV